MTPNALYVWINQQRHRTRGNGSFKTQPGFPPWRRALFTLLQETGGSPELYPMTGEDRWGFCSALDAQRLAERGVDPDQIMAIWLLSFNPSNPER